MENVVRRRPTADPAFPDSRIMRCAFTGYRPQKMPFGFDELLPECIDFKNRIKETIEMLIFQGYTHFLSGGALGMDMYAGEAVLELRKQYPWIALEIVVPFDTQSAKWALPYQTRYDRLLAEANGCVGCCVSIYLFLLTVVKCPWRIVSFLSSWGCVLAFCASYHSCWARRAR